MKIKRQKDGILAYRGIYGDLNNPVIPLAGRHQLDNAALALAAIEITGKNGLPVDDDATIRKGLAKTQWPARLEVLRKTPLFVLDGAHNPAGISVLCRALKNDFSYHRLILIFGALADKDYRRMLRKIVPLAQQIILTQLQSKRAVPVKNIYEYVQKLGYKAVIAENVAGALERALKLAGKEDLICATGSLYLAGEVKQAFPGLVSYDKKPEQT
jgi:dihydrofolate synthase/folylpolyglutamate synthase